MTQTGMVASGALTGWISLGALASAAPRDVVDDAVEAAGSGAKRSRRRGFRAGTVGGVPVADADAWALITGEYSRRRDHAEALSSR